MDAAEAHIKKFLEFRGFTNIIYEPDGNVPPDFLVDHRIAVEVRRLNYHEIYNGKVRGVEEVRIPLTQSVKKLLESFGPPNLGKSWFLLVKFRRPLERWKTLGPRVEGWLRCFRNSDQTKGEKKDFGGGFSLSLFAAKCAHPRLYMLGMVSDWDSGGWVLDDLKRNLEICVAEKTRKVSNVRAQYPEWWLVLTDHIALGLDHFDREQFRDSVSLEHNWDKVILVDPADHTHAFEV